MTEHFHHATAVNLCGVLKLCVHTQLQDRYWWIYASSLKKKTPSLQVLSQVSGFQWERQCDRHLRVSLVSLLNLTVVILLWVWVPIKANVNSFGALTEFSSLQPAPPLTLNLIESWITWTEIDHNFLLIAAKCFEVINSPSLRDSLSDWPTQVILHVQAAAARRDVANYCIRCTLWAACLQRIWSMFVRCVFKRAFLLACVCACVCACVHACACVHKRNRVVVHTFTDELC